MGLFSGRIMAAALGCAVAVSALLAGAAQAADPIKIGVLHSLSGTMAISETTLKDTILMMVDDLNKKGGLLGRPVERSWSIPPPTGRCSPKRRAS